MSLPPPPNPYGGGQPPYGQPPQGGQPQYGGQPQWGGPQSGGAGEEQFNGPPPWGPPPQQPQWGGPPMGPPPSNGGKGKWIIGGVIVLLVIALAVTLTILVTRDGADGDSPTPPGDGQASEFASANDTGPVNIITEDPTCDAWGRITNEYVNRLEAAGWNSRDASLEASVWTPQQRKMYESAGLAMTAAADSAVRLVTVTPHRAMRELYGQFIAYTRDVAGRLQTFVRDDENLIEVSDALSNGISNICSAIAFRSAQPTEPLIGVPEAPLQVAPLGDPSKPSLMMQTAAPVCPDWERAAVEFDEQAAAWFEIDPAIPATEWNSEQAAVVESVKPIMSRYAQELRELGRGSGNLVFEDIAVLAAQYQDAYVKALPTYTKNDNFLDRSASFLVKSLNFACKSAS